MQVRPVLHAAALAAAMLFAAGASAQSERNPAAPANISGGTATPAMKAKAESLKQSIRRGTHDLHMKIEGEQAKSRKARESGEEVTWKSEHERANQSSRKGSTHSSSSNSNSNGMNSSSFRRAMSKCTSNEDMNARADCAREAVEAHGGSTAG